VRIRSREPKGAARASRRGPGLARQPYRSALAWLGVILALAVLLPPGLTVARHYVFAQAVQFAVLAIVAPALLAVGAPWRVIASGLAGRVATARSHRRTTWPSWACLIAFLAAAVGWRLPVTVNALERHPALLVAQALTLLVTGCALWLELVDSPP
jgi:cytochrome c oxidase assembly factor CtaG